MIIIMTNFESVFTVTVLFVACTSSHYASGHLHMPRQIAYADKCDLTARPQCSSDCTKILACVAHAETPILSVNCTGSTPHCDNGRCVATPGKCTKRALENEFLCTSSGVFPDPKDCRKSHFCAEVGSRSVISTCPRGHIFDSKTKVCGPRPIVNSESICQKISCDGVENDFVTFASNPTFYAYCFTSATGVQHTYMYKCDDESNKIFDVTLKKCRFNCKSIGYHADSSDCTAYYICNGLKFASRRVHCPPNYYFNGTVCLNSKAHCPPGSIATSSTENPTSTSDNSMVDDMATSLKPMAVPDSSLPDETTPISTSIPDDSLVDEMTSTSAPMTDSSAADEVTSASSSIADSSAGDEMTSASSPIADSLLADELTSTPIADNSLPNEMSTTYEPTSAVEVTTRSTAMPFSESSTTEAPITHKPATTGNVDSEMNLTTKKPWIWKHMGLISVRVGRLLNIV